MAGMDGSRVILIAGPTASGKSALAVRIAERFGALVVNADSMQVYRDLRLLTSRPSAEDEERVPHRLYGHMDALEPYSVGRYLTEAEHIIGEANGRPLIFVGGTGLYLDALTRGLARAPEIADTVRAYWRERARSETAAALHEELRRRDPDMAGRLRASDPQRIVRALEVVDSTGRSLAHWQQAGGRPPVGPSAAKIVLRPDRAVLRERIAARFGRMMEEGALDEVRALLARNLTPTLPVMKAIGVAPLAAHLRGEIDLESAVGRAVTDTRQYAKRQETWFRNRFAEWKHLRAEDAERAILSL